MAEDYPWYELVAGTELRQGDIFFDCPVLVPASEIPEAESENLTLIADVLTYDVIVMSQSCDLENAKLDLVLVCPHWGLGEFGEKVSYFKSRDGKKELQRGNTPGYHLINRSELDSRMVELRVVDFRNVYGLPFVYLKTLSERRGKRLRLLPPYREHLSQAFARFFMRVGLPVPVDLNSP